MAAPQQKIAVIDRKIATSTPPGTAWTPPTISDLIQRIDAALRERSGRLTGKQRCRSPSVFGGSNDTDDPSSRTGSAHMPF